MLLSFPILGQHTDSNCNDIINIIEEINQIIQPKTNTSNSIRRLCTHYYKLNKYNQVTKYDSILSELIFNTIVSSKNLLKSDLDLFISKNWFFLTKSHIDQLIEIVNTNKEFYHLKSGYPLKYYYNIPKFTDIDIDTSFNGFKELVFSSKYLIDPSSDLKRNCLAYLINNGNAQVEQDVINFFLSKEIMEFHGSLAVLLKFLDEIQSISFWKRIETEMTVILNKGISSENRSISYPIESSFIGQYNRLFRPNVFKELNQNFKRAYSESEKVKGIDKNFLKFNFLLDKSNPLDLSFWNGITQLNFEVNKNK